AVPVHVPRGDIQVPLVAVQRIRVGGIVDAEPVGAVERAGDAGETRGAPVAEDHKHRPPGFPTRYGDDGRVAMPIAVQVTDAGHLAAEAAIGAAGGYGAGDLGGAEREARAVCGAADGVVGGLATPPIVA